MIRRICCIYFSPTENTKKLALAAAGHIAREYNLPLQEVDFTKKDKRSQLYEFGSEDFVILAVPTYAGKLPIFPLQRRVLLQGGEHHVLSAWRVLDGVAHDVDQDLLDPQL
ncbi:MAG: hypothetical protein IJH60_02515, partial [Eubacterium sp.]|nr:hypothetical protein [Eubacterium sp.]